MPQSKLGRNFWSLWTASGISGLGDGIRLAALPLLAARITRDPVGVAMVTLAGQLPWMLFTLISGALVDRADRKRAMWQVDLGRTLVVGFIAFVASTGGATIPLLCVAAFLLGTGETVFDNASQAILQFLVDRTQFERANSRLQMVQTLSWEFLGPPVGAFFFTVAAGLPFAIDATSFFVAAALVYLIPGKFKTTSVTPRQRLDREIAEGLRWLWRNRVLRQLALILQHVGGFHNGHPSSFDPFSYTP